MKKAILIIVIFIIVGCFKTVTKDPYSYSDIKITPNKCLNCERK